jgi:hypothetical protein
MYTLAARAITFKRDPLIILLSNFKKLAALRALLIIILIYFLKKSLGFR